MTSNDNAPGCFGSPSAITPGEGVCEACAVASACLTASKQTLVKIERDVVGGRKLDHLWAKLEGKKKRRVYAVIERRSTLDEGLEGVAVKARPVVRKLRTAFRNAPDDLRRGKNPFAGQKPQFLAVVGDMLASGGFSKQELVSRFCQDFSWSEATARSHQSIAIAAFSYLGWIDEDGDRFTMRGA